MPEVILGIDPGLRVAGFSVIQCTDRGSLLMDLGFFSQKSSEPLVCRVGKFHQFMKQKIQEYKVSIIALETPFFGRNAQTFLKLGYLRGGMYILAHEYGLELHEFSPREVKMAVTGNGGSGKEQVANMLFLMYPDLKNFACSVRNDVTDALGVGLCGAWKLREEKLLEKTF